MKIAGWWRPLRREFWRLVPNWKRVHTFMGAQALTFGGLVLTVFIAVGAPDWLLLTVLFLTCAASLYGTLVDQPEVNDA